ncbi:metal ABC transporter ATP-binding protein [Lacticaseibacillus pantheris]|uniref:Zinc iron ABC transporter, ATP-binding subunit n=1 Tax=Lacticaseibacillus pantheris DSM 15945 = JCM 12539 = NBRC 106106 TaxID=1423783 RepID=A0A0R1TUI1_9LACO|nr:ATP-binding cassette domain-containing protein [Lacticaseibacillus pantheris]KRL84903.1 zinc iron ABC transporter, ATP-binding subunit [Lacticaseibacillus pantheris DSM 15945 = JCM 12539 = NBRC 106106]WKF85134.1 ATP-binding cassette domain-containing protein [Lacticaseibacillus pantheris]
MRILTGKDVGIQFADNKRWLYRHVDFHLDSSQILALVGDNGVGKTTLIRAIMGQRALTEGELVRDHAQDLRIGYVPQYHDDIGAFPLHIADFVGLSYDRGLLPWLRRSEKEHLEHVLNEANLTEIANERIDRASGGEKQRAFLAQAMIQDPDVLILDEATANLDNVAKFALMDVVKHYRDHHDLSVIMVSHDLDIVERYSDNYLLLSPDGAEFGPIADLDTSKLEEGGRDHV